MAQILGLDRLREKLRRLAAKAKKDHDADVTTGFTQQYALVVHEIPANHPVGEVEYLIKAVRQVEKEVRKNIATAYKNGATLEKALLIGALRIQREAQNKTPVDTGALKASAFTDYTRNADRSAGVAYARSEGIRQSAGKGKK